MHRRLARLSLGASTGFAVELVLSALLLFSVAALLARAWRQRSYFRVLDREPAPREPTPSVTVVIPARNEASKIGACVEGLTRQAYPRSRFRIIVVDDSSTDGTRSIVAAIARTCPIVSVVSAPPLPAGWTGKSHACWVGAQIETDTEWLCFIDADTRHRPELLASALAAAQRNDLDFLSLVPRQELGSFAERLIMPCGFYLLAFLQDVREPLDQESEKTTACGQFILVRRFAYLDVGGHSAVAGALSEDVALARAMKRSGWRTAVFGGERLLSARMYDGYASLRAGLTRNLVDMLGGPARALITASAGILLAWACLLLPLSTVVTWSPTAADTVSILLAWSAAAAAFAFHIAGARHFGIPAWYGLLFPVGYSVGAGLVIESVWRRRTGRVIWKDRTYPGESQTELRSTSASYSCSQGS